jgi:nitrite reductase/ring-hydroxylating ferredoxin subunit
MLDLTISICAPKAKRPDGQPRAGKVLLRPLPPPLLWYPFHGVISFGATMPIQLVETTRRLRHLQIPTTPATAPTVTGEALGYLVAEDLMEDKAYSVELLVNPVASTGKAQTHVFVRAGTLEELRSKGRLLVHGPHRPILVIEEQDRVYALDNRCPHMGFPLDLGSVEDGILTCHWHHARFDLASGCTFDLWADDVPTCPVEVRGGEVWVRVEFGHREPGAYWRQRLHEAWLTILGSSLQKHCRVN